MTTTTTIKVLLMRFIDALLVQKANSSIGYLFLRIHHPRHRLVVALPADNRNEVDVDDDVDADSDENMLLSNLQQRCVESFILVGLEKDANKELREKAILSMSHNVMRVYLRETLSQNRTVEKNDDARIGHDRTSVNKNRILKMMLSYYQVYTRGVVDIVICLDTAKFQGDIVERLNHIVKQRVFPLRN
jgi:hypothetical protein